MVIKAQESLRLKRKWRTIRKKTMQKRQKDRTKISSEKSRYSIRKFAPYFDPEVHNPYIKSMVKREKLMKLLQKQAEMMNRSFQPKPSFLRLCVEASFIGL